MNDRAPAERLSPANPLEHGLARAQAGDLAIPDFLAILIEAELVVPSASEPDADGNGLQPLYFDRDGVPMLAVFSGLERVTKFASVAPFALQMPTRALLRALAPNTGIVLNPTYDLGFEVPPDGIARFLRDAH